MRKHDSQYQSHDGEHTTTNTTPAEVSNTQPAADDTRYLDQLAELWAGHRLCGPSVGATSSWLVVVGGGRAYNQPPYQSQALNLGQPPLAAERLLRPGEPPGRTDRLFGFP